MEAIAKACKIIARYVFLLLQRLRFAVTFNNMSNAISFRIRAPFHINGAWKWLTWTTEDANKHSAMIAKAREIGATSWDYGQADHELTSRAGF